ncbi:hypothetical protein GCM10010304_77100 [Streptomyces roseoviolaceus]
MLNGDVRRVQSAIAGEVAAVRQHGLLRPGRSPVVLVEIGTGQRLQPGESPGVVELQPLGIGLARPFGVQLMGADDRPVCGAGVPQQGQPPASRIANSDSIRGDPYDADTFCAPCAAEIASRGRPLALCSELP